MLYDKYLQTQKMTTAHKGLNQLEVIIVGDNISQTS